MSDPSPPLQPPPPPAEEEDTLAASERETKRSKSSLCVPPGASSYDLVLDILPRLVENGFALDIVGLVDVTRAARLVPVDGKGKPDTLYWLLHHAFLSSPPLLSPPRGAGRSFVARRAARLFHLDELHGDSSDNAYVSRDSSDDDYFSRHRLAALALGHSERSNLFDAAAGGPLLCDDCAEPATGVCSTCLGNRDKSILCETCILVGGRLIEDAAAGGPSPCGNWLCVECWAEDYDAKVYADIAALLRKATVAREQERRKKKGLEEQEF